MSIRPEFLDERLYIAFTEARKGKQGTVDEYKFEMNFAENLRQLREDILNWQYAPSRSTAFINHNPVDREIFAAPFRDRVVHHLICDFIMDWWDRRLIHASYSCRKNRGTDAGVRDLYKKMRSVSRNFTRETVVVKIDLSSYFCNIPRKKLYDRILWGLKQQFLKSGHHGRDEDIYKMLKFLCRQVIFDDPVRGVRIKGSTLDWRNYPRRKSLFYQRKGVGIVIGNLTSQMFSNVYLDQLDRFATISLGVKAYGRYVDDAFFVIPQDELDEFMETKMPMIRDHINGMGLVMNPKKTFCQNIRHGVPFLGAVVYPYHVLPGERIVRNFRKAVTRVQAGEEDLDVLISYLGRLQHYDSGNLIEKVFHEHGLDYVRDSKMVRGSKYFTDPKAYDAMNFWKK